MQTKLCGERLDHQVRESTFTKQCKKTAATSLKVLTLEINPGVHKKNPVKWAGMQMTTKW